MRQKLNCILLIDDSEPTNFLHKKIIGKADCANKCVAFESAEKALHYLKSEENGHYPQPDLIFLDINMPRMNGWEFLEHYKKLPLAQQGKIVVVMLTTSLNPDDKKTAVNNGYLDDFINKPLTVDRLNNVLTKYFD